MVVSFREQRESIIIQPQVINADEMIVSELIDHGLTTVLPNLQVFRLFLPFEVRPEVDRVDPSKVFGVFNEVPHGEEIPGLIQQLNEFHGLDPEITLDRLIQDSTHFYSVYAGMFANRIPCPDSDPEVRTTGLEPSYIGRLSDPDDIAADLARLGAQIIKRNVGISDKLLQGTPLTVNDIKETDLLLFAVISTLRSGMTEEEAVDYRDDTTSRISRIPRKLQRMFYISYKGALYHLFLAPRHQEHPALKPPSRETVARLGNDYQVMLNIGKWGHPLLRRLQQIDTALRNRTDPSWTVFESYD